MARSGVSGAEAPWLLKLGLHFVRSNSGQHYLRRDPFLPANSKNGRFARTLRPSFEGGREVCGSQRSRFCRRSRRLRGRQRRVGEQGRGGEGNPRKPCQRKARRQLLGHLRSFSSWTVSCGAAMKRAKCVHPRQSTGAVVRGGSSANSDAFDLPLLRATRCKEVGVPRRWWTPRSFKMRLARRPRGEARQDGWAGVFRWSRVSSLRQNS